MRKDYRIEGDRLVPETVGEGVLQCYIMPDEAEREYLEMELGISAHNITSSLDPDEIGRAEFGQGHFFLIVKSPSNLSTEQSYSFKVGTFGMALYKEHVVMISAEEETEILGARHQSRLVDATSIVLHALSKTVSHFLSHLKVMDMISNELERKIDESMENSHLLDMFGIEKSLVYYLSGIHANLVVMERLKAHADRLGLETEQKEFLDDIMIENQQCNRQAEIYASIMAGLTEARGSIVNNNLSVLIKRLTIVSVVFLPLNVIAGIGGMSEYSAMTEGVPFHISYPLLFLGLGVVAFITYWAIQRMSVVRKKRERRISRHRSFLRKLG